MASPSGKESPISNGEESSQDSSAMDANQDNTNNAKVKDEPADSGYEPNTFNENRSSSNSRASSPPSSVTHETASPSQDADIPASPQSESQQVSGNDTSSSIRSHLHAPSGGKKVDSVQNIVEGLLKKNATLLAMSDAEGLKPNSKRTKVPENNSKREASNSSVGQSTVFPISTLSQTRMVTRQGNTEKRRNVYNKGQFLRPKSPTLKCESILRDDTQLSYAVMEAKVGDPVAEKVFQVQHHELVCAVSLKSYVTDRDKKVVAVLDNSYYWCNFCSFSSTNKELLTQHVMDHRFRCFHCPYEAFCRSDILRHMDVTHSESYSSTESLAYCTFLSDYLRVKSRAERMESKSPCIDPDDDVDDLDKDDIKDALLKSDSQRKEYDGEVHELPVKRPRMDDDARTSESSDASHLERSGKSRKSQNPRRHPQPSENDYDTFEMEVEEINDFIENGNENNAKKMKVMYPSKIVSEDVMEPSKSVSSPMMSRMQVIPSIQDGGKQGFTATHVPSPAPSHPGPGRPPKSSPFNKTKRTSSSSSLYWSCGYCDFQSNSQAEIKEHSNRNHPGNPHRSKNVINKQVKISCDHKTEGHHILATDGDQDVDVASESESELGPYDHFNVNSVITESKEHVCGNTLSDCQCECDDIGSKFDKASNGIQEEKSKICPRAHSGLTVDIGNDKPKKENKFKDLNEFDENVTVLKSKLSRVESKGATQLGTSIELKYHATDTDKEEAMENCVLDTCASEMLSKAGIATKDESLSFSFSESLSSPPLKLTFKTIGQITTCSIKDKSDSSSSGKGETSVALETQQVSPFINKDAAELERSLIDSSDESDFDIVSNPRSTALSVSSISEIFENSVGSPSRDSVLGTEAGDENNVDFVIKSGKNRCVPVCNETIIKLSPPCTNSPKLSSEKMSLTCVPARSAAVKAMNRMKPSIEIEMTIHGDDNHKQMGYSGNKKQSAKSKISHGKTSLSIPQEPFPKIPSKNVMKRVFSCHHCSRLKAVTLLQIKSHLIKHHPHEPPIVIHVRQQQNGTKTKKRKWYMCLFPSCKKLYKTDTDLDYHKNEHHNHSSSAILAKPKERKTMNSLSTSSVSSITQVLSPPASVSRGSESISNCSVKLHHLDMAQLSRYHVKSSERNEGGRYECLYCTENFSCNTLIDIKQHYFSEHSSQLLVMRDVEAKRSQLPSRIYVCDDTSCDFQSSCRNDILAHSSSHSANCMCVYECPSCGWYSSSYRVAEDHVKYVHADEQNISLFRMQLSVDDNGQTTRKIMR